MIYVVSVTTSYDQRYPGQRTRTDAGQLKRRNRNYRNNKTRAHTHQAYVYIIYILSYNEILDFSIIVSQVSRPSSLKRICRDFAVIHSELLHDLIHALFGLVLFSFLQR